MFLRIFLITAVVSFGPAYTSVMAAQDVTLTKTGVALSIKADEHLGARINDCFRKAIRQSENYYLGTHNPDLVLDVIAQQALNEKNLVILSVSFQKSFDNKAMVKHWATGFRQGLPYAAQTSLQQATNGLYHRASHSLHVIDTQHIDNTCKNVLNAAGDTPG